MSVLASAWRLRGLTLPQLAARVWAAADGDEVVHRAAALSYSFLFSIFPLLLFVTSLLRLLPVHHVIGQLMESAAQVLPDEAAAAVRQTLRQVIATSGHRGLVSLGALTALWVGSTGLATLMAMLNVIHRAHDARPWWRRRLAAVLLTALLAAFVIAATLLTMLSARLGAELGWAARTLAAVVPVALVLLAVDLVYGVATAWRRPWSWLSPGTVTFTALWLVMSFGLRVYVANFAHYDLMYGAIGGLILFLLWMFLTSAALLVGAEVNRVIAEAAADGAAGPDAAGRREA
jgi:membrane protein